MNENIYRQPLVLFLGAGASAPLGKMPTVQFLAWLKSQVPEVTHFVNAAERHLRRSEEVEALDVEAVLDFIEDLVRAGKFFQDFGGQELLREREELQKIKNVIYAPRIPSIHRVEENERLRDQIKDLVVEHYSEIDELKASRLYYPLVKLAEWQPLPVFTTNYDVAIEKTYEEYADSYPTFDDKRSLRLIDGFDRTKLTPEWSSFACRDYKPTGVDVIFFKLHGSVDWVHTPSGAIQRLPSGKRDPAGMSTIIAYPSRLKREIHEEPFRTNYDYLIACLLHAKVCAVIGFSFRDQEIVEEFRQAMGLNKDLELMIIDPRAEAIEYHLYTKLGFKPKADPVKEEFNIESAQSIADRIKAKVDKAMNVKEQNDATKS